MEGKVDIDTLKFSRGSTFEEVLFFLDRFIGINGEGDEDDDVEGSWRVLAFLEECFWRGILLHRIFSSFLVIN